MDRNVCAGAGLCALTAPEVFDQDEEDGLVRLLVPEPSPEEAESAEQAVRLCPSRAIRSVRTEPSVEGA
ncbi:ferredoxin [Nocardiopsis aegyptia]|uniref:ferredoxin n=1 Tax=Nocardiopsis aegyptia TaxID=220378 RepID=UPI00366D1460